ncbi:hypothetical protein [Aulosira sp. FACHB-615]|nr:hypothetical protein [Aulosira sp. FACHB-615]
MNNPTPKKDQITNIVIGQTINPNKIQIAKELRRQMTPAEKILW